MIFFEKKEGLEKFFLRRKFDDQRKRKTPRTISRNTSTYHKYLAELGFFLNHLTLNCQFSVFNFQFKILLSVDCSLLTFYGVPLRVGLSALSLLASFLPAQKISKFPNPRSRIPFPASLAKDAAPIPNANRTKN